MTTVDERTVWAWGANNCGQLGFGHREDLVVPTVLENLALSSSPTGHVQCGKNLAETTTDQASGQGQSTVRQLTGGGAFSVLLTDNGRVLTCGKNDRGQLGQDSRTRENNKTNPDVLVFSPCSLTDSVRVTHVEAGWDFILALTDAGSILTWGSHSFGQLGRILPPGVKMDSTPQPVNAPSSGACKFVAVAAGLRHALAISESGEVYSWGSGRRGQLGVVDQQGKPVPSSNMPIQLSLADDAKALQVVAGMNCSGILTESGMVHVWGCNKFGQCGVCPTSEIMLNLPNYLEVPDNKNRAFKIVSLTAGWTHMVLRTESGDLYSWGRADLGQLGRSTDQEPSHIPSQIGSIQNVAAHCCSSEHNLALTDKGQVYSWGWNEHGICGTGDETNMFWPVLISPLADKKMVSIGCGAGHCFCWTGKPT